MLRPLLAVLLLAVLPAAQACTDAPSSTSTTPRGMDFVVLEGGHEVFREDTRQVYREAYNSYCSGPTGAPLLAFDGRFAVWEWNGALHGADLAARPVVPRELARGGALDDGVWMVWDGPAIHATDLATGEDWRVFPPEGWAVMEVRATSVVAFPDTFAGPDFQVLDVRTREWREVRQAGPWPSDPVRYEKTGRGWAVFSVDQDLWAVRLSDGRSFGPYPLDPPGAGTTTSSYSYGWPSVAAVQGDEVLVERHQYPGGPYAYQAWRIGLGNGTVHAGGFPPPVSPYTPRYEKTGLFGASTTSATIPPGNATTAGGSSGGSAWAPTAALPWVAAAVLAVAVMRRRVA